MDQFIKEALDAHNQQRRLHGQEPLKLNKEICGVAQKWADHIAAADTFKHSTERKHGEKNMGESIAMKYTSSGDDFTGQQVTDQWYSEIERYDFHADAGPSTGHFTQVIWKASQEFGIGKAKTKDGKWFVVANYHPAGNIYGQYAKNVFPPTDGKFVPPPKPAQPNPPAKQDQPKVLQTKQDQNKVPVPVVYSAVKASDKMDQKDQKTRTEKTTSVTTETKDGKVITKTVVTETTHRPDGSKSVNTSTQVSTRTAGHATEEGNALTESKESAKNPQKVEDFISEALEFHNEYRKNHGVSALKHNSELSKKAQDWAEKLAERGELAHSNNTHNNKMLGENVASKWSSLGADYTGKDVTNQWYGEVSKFDFESPDFKQGTGHFSQIVWKGSEEVGFGKAHKDGRVYVVANYYPPGNVRGQFADNVCSAKEQ